MLFFVVFSVFSIQLHVACVPMQENCLQFPPLFRLIRFNYFLLPLFGYSPQSCASILRGKCNFKFLTPMQNITYILNPFGWHKLNINHVFDVKVFSRRCKKVENTRQSIKFKAASNRFFCKADKLKTKIECLGVCPSLQSQLAFRTSAPSV